MSPANPHDDRQPADSGGMPDTFEEIVAGWRAEGAVPRWPRDRPGGGYPGQAELGRPDAAGPEIDGTEIRRPEFRRPAPPRSDEPDSDDDHFVPPEPPPMPRPGRAAAAGLGLLAAGLLLVVAPEVLGIADSVGLTLGLLTLAGGLGWLVLRSWTSDPGGDGDGQDDGAVF